MRITDLKDFEARNIDWVAVGERIKQYRNKHYETQEDFARDADLCQGNVESIERGRGRKDINCLWKIRTELGLSFNWMLNGVGSPKKKDPKRLMPESIIVQRGRGIRRDQETSDTSEGKYGKDVLEFISAIDAYKRINNVMHPKWSEILRVLHGLGYRKIASSTISPRKIKT